MEPISEEIVERTWREVACFSPDRAEREMEKIGRSQPELLAFMVGGTEDMGREVRELGLYMFFVIFRMFQSVLGRIGRISSEDIIECYEHNEALIERLVGAHEKILERVVRFQISKQPHVLKYVVEALMEEEKGDSFTLTEEEKGFLFLLLKTVVDVLDRKARESPPRI
jgi:hypothetical protein